MKKPVKLLTAAMACCASLSVVVPQASAEVATIYGFMATSDEWRDVEPAWAQHGFYSFAADGSAGFSAASPISADNEWALSGAAYVDGTYYCYTTSGSWMEYTLTFRAIDSRTWTVTDRKSFTYSYYDRDTEESKKAELDPSDLAYDAVNGVIYAAVHKFEGDTDSYLCTVDTSTGELIRVAPIPQMAALTADSKGELQGIGIDGNLYAIGHDGTSTVIGHTGYYPSRGLNQSATTDFADGAIYWSAMCFATENDRNYNINGIYAMIKVDAATGSSEIIWEYPRQQRFSAINVHNSHPESPADITDLTFVPTVFEQPEAKVAFTVPSLSATSQPLSGSVTVKVYIDGDLKSTKVATPGSRFEEAFGGLTNGEHTASVELDYKGFTGTRVYASTYIGPDLPAKITKVYLTSPGSEAGIYTKAHIRWDAPTVGEHGAPYDQSKIRYRVVRYPDETVVKRSLTGTELDDEVTAEYGRVFYAVIPYNSARPTDLGATTTSNGMMLGNDITVPYSETFDTPNSMRSFTLVDANGDGSDAWESPCWKYDEQYACAFYYGRPDHPADDWLITPPIKFDPNRLYRLSYKYYGYYGYGNHFQVAIGTEPTPESLSRVFQDVEKVTTQMDHPGLESTVLFAPHEGDRFVGFHHISTTMEHLSIDDIMIEDVGDSRIPDKVTSLTANRVTSGSAKVAFVAPVSDAAGRSLTESVTVKIYRTGNESPVATFADTKVGTPITWTDEEAVKGRNSYTVTATNSFGEGLPAEVTVDLSDAIPASVENVKARYINDRQVELTWDPVTTSDGTSESPMDLDELRYTVYQPVSNSEGAVEYRVVAYDLETTRFIHDEPLAGEDGDGQQVIVYYVSAVNPAGESVAALSPGIIAGPSYQLPFAETWYQQTQNTNPWIKDGTNGAGWYIRHKGYDPVCDGADGYGVLTCETNFGYTSGMGVILTPRIDLTSMTDPEVTFYFYRSPVYEQNVALIVGITTDAEPAINYISDAMFAKTETAGWEKVTVNLAAYANEKRASIALIAQVKENNFIHIDNFRIEGKANAGNIRAEYITGPSECKENSPVTFKGTVFNYSSQAATNVTATLSAKGKTIGTATIPSIKASGSAEVSFSFTPAEEHVGATVLSLVAGNSDSPATKEINVEEFNPAYVTDLSGKLASGKLLLSWSHPTCTEQARKGTDGFEYYDAFAIDSLGTWTLHDGDGFLPFQFSDGEGSVITWPNYDKPQAFAVYNPEYLPQAPATRSSNQCLIAWGSPYGANNDWLISPELPAGKQVISFFIRAFGAGNEQFKVLVSRTDSNPESFIPLTGNEPLTAPDEWEYRFYTLPEDTKYFAINYVGNKQDALMIDDVRFFGYHNQLVPDGYNIYCDGRKLNGTLLTSRYFVDPDIADDGEHTYIVRAVYNGVESPDSNHYRFDLAGIGSIDAAAGLPVITTDKGVIHVEGAAGGRIEVYRPDGTLVAALDNQYTADIYLPTGVYVVKVAAHSVKAMVK